MNCTYCGTQNSDAEHRCGRCGRRLHLDTVGPVPAPELYPTTRSSAAPSLDTRQAIPADVAQAALETVPAAPRQRSLFPEPVLKFEDFAPAQPRRKARRPSAQPARQRVSRKRMRLEEAGQQRLELEIPRPALPPEMDSGVRSVKSASQAVAKPLHRLMAASMDVGMVVAATMSFFAVYNWLGGAGAVAVLPGPVYAAILIGIIALYKALWWLGNCDSPGMMWCRVRLLSFTGQPPTRTQRAHRFAGTVLSVAAAGLGLLWALGDEEQLCWNDYLSKTFPSPRYPG